MTKHRRSRAFSKGLGERIRIARVADGLTQQELGERVCITRAAISLFESGGACPSAESVADICAALRCSADYLLGLADE